MALKSAAVVLGAGVLACLAPLVAAQESAPGAVLSDEVSALSLASPELDRATERLESTVAAIEAAQFDLVATAVESTTTARAQEAVSSMLEHR